MSSLCLVPNDPRDREAPARPTAEAGKVIELELSRTPTELVRVSTVVYDSRALLEIATWRVRSDRGSWFRASLTRIAPHEAQDVAIALLSGARRAGQ